MRHAAVYFAEQLASRFSGKDFDAIFCSDFLNAAEFRGLVGESLRGLPMVVYFHENQFAYPSRRHDERDLHFGFTNFTSCLAADQVWFNSSFNRDSFFAGLEKACGKWPDYQPTDSIQRIKTKCHVEPPGIVSGQTLREISSVAEANRPVNLVWASRWEHDKNPRLLLEALRALKSRGIDFRINVIGQSFRRVPDEFPQIQAEFCGEIRRWGYQESRSDYEAALAESDIFISTADHEFFGIAAAEAILGGLIPLLPSRLAYPELLRVDLEPSRKQLFLYDGSAEDFTDKVDFLAKNLGNESLIEQHSRLQNELRGDLDWGTRAPLMDDKIEAVVRYARGDS